MQLSNIQTSEILPQLGLAVLAADDNALRPDLPTIGGWSLLHLLSLEEDPEVPPYISSSPFIFTYYDVVLGSLQSPGQVSSCR